MENEAQASFATQHPATLEATLHECRDSPWFWKVKESYLEWKTYNLPYGGLSHRLLAKVPLMFKSGNKYFVVEQGTVIARTTPTQHAEHKAQLAPDVFLVLRGTEVFTNQSHTMMSDRYTTVSDAKDFMEAAMENLLGDYCRINIDLLKEKVKTC